MDKVPKAEMTEEEIDRNLSESFPASDPPSWTLGSDHTGASCESDIATPDDLIVPDR